LRKQKKRKKQAKKRDKLMKFFFTDQHAKKAMILFRQWKVLFKVILLDLLYVITLFCLATFFDIIFESYESALVGSIYGYLLFFGYFAVVVFYYSFFKYCFFDLFEEFQGKKQKMNFTELPAFYGFNSIILSGALILFLVLYFFFSIALVDILKKGAVLVLFILFGCGGYLLLQASHLAFSKRKKFAILETVKEAKTLISPALIGKWLFWNVLFALCGFVVYLILFYFIAKTGQSAATDARAMMLFTALNIFLFALFVLFSYFLILWNRLYLFLVFSEGK
jgi:hypothetical protein